MSDKQAAILMVLSVFGGIIFTAVASFLIFQALVCWHLSSCLNKVPEKYRTQTPGMVWMLMVPCLSLVWNFFVFPRISQSYRAYFKSRNDLTVGDCGEGLGVAYCIVFVMNLVPYVNILTGTAGFVLLIIYMVKVYELKKKIVQIETQTAPSTAVQTA